MTQTRGSFVTLYCAIRDTTRSSEKERLLAEYLQETSDRDFGWAVFLLHGGRCRGRVSTRELRQWAAEFSDVPDWLVEESYSVAGDLAETISLLVAAASPSESIVPCGQTLEEWIRYIDELSTLDAESRKQRMFRLWKGMSQPEILVFTKVLTGGLRIGVSKGLVVRALARVMDVSTELMWQHLATDWRPETLSRETLAKPVDTATSLAPYPFFLAYPVERDALFCSSPEDWQCEWKWDGIRAQIVVRGGKVALWSRGAELISDGFPELAQEFIGITEGAVLDGEIVAWSSDDCPADFSVLQRRLNRTKVTPAFVKSAPVRFIIYDLLEYSGEDMRQLPLRERRQKLVTLWESHASTLRYGMLSPILEGASWEEVSLLQGRARSHGAEGVMLKRLDSLYGVGRTSRGAWWKWKVVPHSVDAVLLYAQKGHGRRADLFTDYTFGVWHDGVLVSFTKAYSGLSDSEMREVDAFIKRNTKERFGPVRTVRPELVFEIAFERIWPSKRHRSGVAVRFPRIVRWRRDKPALEADTLESLQALLAMADTKQQED